MQLIDHDAVIDVPPDVAVCPYCKGELRCRAIEWIENDVDVIISAGEIELECDGDHDYPMPYVYWHPVADKVKAWMNENYDFDMQNWQAKLERWNG